MSSKKKTNIIKFPSSPSKLERQIEAILFAASEPLDIETIEKRIQNVTNIQKTLEKILLDFGILQNNYLSMFQQIIRLVIIA